jgi:alpha-galactosidase
MRQFLLAILIVLWIASARLAWAAAPTPAEMTEAQQWAAIMFERASDTNSAVSFFSFVYDGKSSGELLKTWTVKQESRVLDSQRAEYTIIYTDPKTGLTVRCVGIEYRDFPAVEWLLYFKNTGGKDTPILENVRALDLRLARPSLGGFVVHHARGTDAGISDFAPLSDAIESGRPLKISSFNRESRGGARGGSPSVQSMPFFNVESDGQGRIVGLGWTAPWSADFARDAGETLRLSAGMERMHLLLHPGEEIRSPRVAMLFWRGDRLRAHNLWRRFLLAYHSPRPGGKPFAGLIAEGNWGNWMNAETHIAELNYWGDHNLPMECYWIDAGWTDMSRGWEAHQSQQTPDTKLFPNGMYPIVDAAHRRGMKFLLWMVPTSVHPAVGIGKEHPQWLGKPISAKEYGNMVFYGLDHGDPKITQFMIDYFSKIVSDFGIDVFRQDGGNLWPAETDPDRIGINPIRFVTGAYAFWDGLLKNHPQLLIDNCAEGGRKIDLETIGRSIVFWRSDYQAFADSELPISNQGYNCGLLPWIPLCGSVVVASKPKLDAYSFRSAYCPVLQVGWPMATVKNVKDRWANVDVDLLRKLLNEYVSVRHYLLGDFYPLLPYSLDPTAWSGWQFDRPDLGEGMVQVFRRPNCRDNSVVVTLHGLDADATYTLRNLDLPGGKATTGRELLSRGIRVPINDRPGSAVITYKKKPKSP